ncbi:MAG: hypothetical protein H7Y20_15140 [Bryobacteraceae bacterium]|nr:hypothetical protein [Bryobacteraceae bacterium]
MQASIVVNPESDAEHERVAALEAALASQAFSRSDQLSRFLRFVCERELAGAGTEINEFGRNIVKHHNRRAQRVKACFHPDD